MALKSSTTGKLQNLKEVSISKVLREKEIISTIYNEKYIIKTTVDLLLRIKL